MGTASTRAIDRFDEIAYVPEDYPAIWVHVDAPYAEAALVCEEYQHLTQHFEALNSFDMNMSKRLLTNIDARYASLRSISNKFASRHCIDFSYSCMFVRRRQDLIDTPSATPSYLRNRYSAADDVTDYRDWQFGLSRRFRVLKIWFVMRTYGVDGFQSHIRSHVTLGELFHSLVASRPDLFQVVGMPAFALTVFTVRPRRQSVSTRPVRKYRVAKVKSIRAGRRIKMSANKLTEYVYETINRWGEIYLTSILVGSTYAIRVLCAHPNVEEQYVRKVFEILVKTTEEVFYEH